MLMRRSGLATRFLSAIAIATLCYAATGGAGRAQSLVVLPVGITMAAGQNAAILTVINKSDTETAFQVRAFTWSQPGDGDPAASPDRLTPTDELLVSPPLGAIAAGATQVVRLVLRRPALGQEASYRIFLDQIPPPASPGTVRIAIRMSIPVFVRPAVRVASNVRWRIEDRGGRDYLTAFNEGTRHETVHDIALAAAGAPVRVKANASQYILPGATRVWPVDLPAGALAAGAGMRLTAQGDSVKIDQQVGLSEKP